MHDAVLLIEDNHDLRVCERQILEDKGINVLSATNGRDALNLIRNGLNPKVIILDLKMPIMDGEEFLNFIEENNFCADSQIVIVTSQFKDMNSSRISNYFPKPFAIQEFSDLIHQMYRRQDL